MELDLDSYFSDIDLKYYEPKYMITILKSILDKNFNDIKSIVNNSRVLVTKEQITNFLEKKWEEENFELKKRIESKKTKKKENFVRRIKEDIDAISLEFTDELESLRYHFEPYTLEYFTKYSNIIKNKTLLLLYIIEKLGNKDIISISDLVLDLDIQLDENKNISKQDIIRLITPLVYNFNELIEKTTRANDLSTYLTFKMSPSSLFKDGLSDQDIYPSSLLQIKSLDCDFINGSISLTDNQIKELEKAQRKNIKKLTKMLINL